MTALGFSLLLVGAIVVIAETHVQSLGMLGAPGVLALGAGAVLAVSGLGGGLVLGIGTAVVLVIATGALLTVVLREGIGVRRRRVRTGPEGLIGQIGVVRSWGDPEPTGRVLVGGALWRARRSWHDGDEGELHEGDAIVVERLSGLTLSVRRAEDWELAP